MPDYKSMYAVLFRAMTKAIELMQAAQQATEEMYISDNDPVITGLPKSGGDCDGNGGQS